MFVTVQRTAKCEKIYYANAIYSRLNAFMCEKYLDTSYPAKSWARERNHGDCEVLEDPDGGGQRNDKQDIEGRIEPEEVEPRKKTVKVREERGKE